MRHDCRECEKRCGQEALRADAKERPEPYGDRDVFIQPPLHLGVDVEPRTCPHGQKFWVAEVDR